MSASPDRVAPAAPVNADRICIICNGRSGRNSHEADAVDRAAARMPDTTEIRRIGKGRDIAAAAQQAVDDGYGTIVAAGGDGTQMAVAGVLAGTGVRMGVLPLGTFNYFARGLGIPTEPDEAGAILAQSEPRPVSVGQIGGHTFLNNTSLGVYPAILKERETVYSRWGRWRIAAHWSVIKTFIRFQRPLTVDIEVDGTRRSYRTPLIFVAHSGFQLQRFGLPGADCIADGKFAVFVGTRLGRLGLLAQCWRLVTGRMREGKDYDLICTDDLTLHTRRKRHLVAIDGEKLRLNSPLRVTVLHDALTVLVPPDTT